MAEEMNLAATGLLTAARIASDELLVPVWPPLGAVAAERTVFDDGIRYLLLLPRLDLRVDIRTTTIPTPTLAMTLDARPRGLWRRAGAAASHPLDGGFERIASELLTDGSIESVERALQRCRTSLWNHPSFGHDAVGLRRVA